MNKANHSAIIIGKIIISLMLFTALLKLPYGYYVLVHFVCMIGFIIFALHAFGHKAEAHGFAYLALALLFQPFFKIALGRELWVVIDVIVAVYVLVTLRVGTRED